MKSAPKILFINNNEAMATVLSKTLTFEGKYPNVSSVCNSEALKKALQTEMWDIVLINFQMPEFSSVEALKIIRKDNVNIPIILISGQINERGTLDIIKVGANDFINKSTLSGLGRLIKREISALATGRANNQSRHNLQQSRNDLEQSRNDLEQSRN
ncbi:MAG: response regulator, partial [Bdellovibrionia bacterium]